MPTATNFDRGLLPSARDFYQREGLIPERPNGSGWARCKGNPPCHKSKSGRSFSVNLNHGGFFCHGCGRKGDLIAFVRLRDGCSFVDACKTLGAWRTVTPADRMAIVRRRQQRELYRQREIETVAAERCTRLGMRE